MLAMHSSAGDTPPRTRARLDARVVRDAAVAASLRLDQDRLDEHCEHLVVRDVGADRVVATCRLLAPDAARRAGGYAAQELFELGLLDVLRGRIVELGRLRTHSAYRCAAVSRVLWNALAEYLLERRHDYLLACAAVSLADGGHAAASIHCRGVLAAPSPDDLRALPHRPLPLERLRHSIPARPPALMAAAMAHGAWVCGAPGLDVGLARAEIPLLLPLARMRTRNARHFLSSAA